MILKVLNAVIGGTEKPTHIMYKAGLSWNILNEILSSLVSQGFIKKIDTHKSEDRRCHRVYRITEKGESVVQYYQKAEQLLRIN